MQTVEGHGTGQPQSDRVWSIETNGINPIPDRERHGRPVELFWVWCAANISILGVTYGTYLVTFYGLNLPQALLAGTLGAGRRPVVVTVGLQLGGCLAPVVVEVGGDRPG